MARRLLAPARLATRIVIVPAILAVLAGCTKKPGERALDAALEELGQLPETPLASVSLAAVGMDATIDVPAGAVPGSRFAIPRVATPSGDFAVVIERAHGPLAARKRVIAENPHNRLVGYIVEREHALLYHTRAEETDEHHVLVHMDIDGVRHECRNDKEERYTLAQAHTMLRACLTLRAQARRP